MEASKTKRLMDDSRWRYHLEWGKYKSDKHKTKRIVRQEIEDLLHNGWLTKNQLVEIKDFIKERAWQKVRTI